jgi:LacI family transcriptional regulator
MTVSLALRGHRSIPEATRERIQREANRLGYRRDPALQALVAHRIGLETPAYHGTVAWVTAWPTATEWLANNTYRQYYEAFVARAEELGYHVAPVWLGEYRWREAACARAIQARGIEGIAFGPVPHGRELEFPLKEFSAVRLGHSLHDGRIPGAAADLRGAVELAFKKARERGYRRIGLADSQVDLVRLYGHRTAQFIYENANVAEGDRAPPIALKPGDRKALLDYVRNERIDALIAVWPDCLGWIRDGGIRVPQDIGYIQLSDHGLKGVSMVAEAAEAVGVQAMNLLDQRLRHNDRGPLSPHLRISLAPSWSEGKTLPARR